VVGVCHLVRGGGIEEGGREVGQRERLGVARPSHEGVVDRYDPSVRHVPEKEGCE
jgi:hypothetical protein